MQSSSPHGKLEDSNSLLWVLKLMFCVWSIFNLTGVMELAPVAQKLNDAIHLAPVVQKLDSAIHWINHYPVDKY